MRKVTGSRYLMRGTAHARQGHHDSRRGALSLIQTPAAWAGPKCRRLSAIVAELQFDPEILFLEQFHRLLKVVA